MSKPKTEVPCVGIWPALKSSIFPLAKAHREDAAALVKLAGPRVRISYPSGKSEPVPSMEVLDSMLMLLTMTAVEPGGKMAPKDFLLACYEAAPNLTLALLVKVRKKWFKQSKAAKLWRWMASTGGFRTDAHKVKLFSVWDCADCDLVRAYELAHKGEAVEVDDVMKARRSLASAVRAGERTSL